MSLGLPQPIKPDHDLAAFACGHASLDYWLKRRALRNQASGGSRTYVVCEGSKVLAYYCLATGAVEARTAPGRVRRNMPDPIPIMVLGRLVVDASLHGKGLGTGLLKDAILRTLKAAQIAGIRALLVHALDDQAAAFYRNHGFADSLIDPHVLMLPLETAGRAVL